MTKTYALKNQITNFRQKEVEQFDEVWEIFKDLLLACPHHGYDLRGKLGYFYDGLMPKTKRYLEIMCNSTFFKKTPKDAWAYLEENAEYAKMWVDTNEHDRNESTPAKGGMLHLKPEEDMQARVTSEVARQMKSLQLGKNNEAKVFCVLCENEEHDTSHCPEVPVVKDMIKEHNMAMVNWVSNQGKGMNFNNLNPSWKTNENTRWGVP